MSFEKDTSISIEGNKIWAGYGGKQIGSITVSEIDFQWWEDAFIAMGGIMAVGTNKEYRRHGIAGLMMKAAVEYSRSRGYVCGGVSTGATNVARRLYSRTGYEYVFSMQGFVRETRNTHTNMPAGVSIRKYEEGDEHLITDLRHKEYKGFFGCRKPDADRWLSMRKNTLKEDPSSVILAVQNGEIIGYASYFQHWFNLACDIYVADGNDRLEVGRGLIRAMESRLSERKCEIAVFSATEDEPFIQECLKLEGYRPGQKRVFKVNILDLNGLLASMKRAFEGRIQRSNMPNWSGNLRIESGNKIGTVEVGRYPEDHTILFQTSEPTLTQMLCGRISGWEAYLRGLMNVEPKPDEDLGNLLRALLPGIPCCHPIDEWW
jgi:GNAT superfamily N-acetyltransferase